MNEDHDRGGLPAWTVGRILRWCEGYFRQKESSTPRLDAEILLARVLGCTRIRLYVEWGKMLEKDELAALRALVARRGRGEPVAYIVGEREFWSLPLRVDARVLIPRPETEHLVEAILDYVASKGLNGPRIADIGTGSGNIACALAKSLPTATILASDISQAAVDCAEENARNLGFSERIEFVVGDLVEPLRGRGAFDVLASNPPYIAPGEWRDVPATIRSFEPEEALLDGAPDGLGAVRRLLRESPSVLARPGAVACEIGDAQADRVVAIAREAGFGDVSLRKDLAGHRRVIIAVVR